MKTPEPSDLTSTDAERLARALYGLTATATKLNGEFDDNFLLTVAGTPHSVLKISHLAERAAFLELETEMLARLEACDDFEFPRLIPVGGESFTRVPDGMPGSGRFVRLISYVQGRHLADETPCAVATLRSFGALLGTVDKAFLGVNHPAAVRGLRGEGLDGFRWALADSLWVGGALDHVQNPRHRALAERILQRVEQEALPLLPALRHSIVHGDASEYNVLVRDGRAVSLIDFGDMHYTATIGELAVGCVYAMFGTGDPLGSAMHVVAGYESTLPISTVERVALFPLILARLLVSVVNSALRIHHEPSNTYLSVSSAPAWAVLEQIADVPSRVAELVLFGEIDHPVRQPVDELRTVRHERLGPSLSLSYRRPLHVVRGWKQYLYDADGVQYLDAYNNVAHVGHSHPKVVDAIARQAALLNTNTRYLHHLIGEYAERLTAHLPAPLRVCYFVNSGSEANELALRMARAHTGQRDVIVSEGAYHGNTQTLVDVSPYKYAGPGGDGRPDWVHEVAMPDVYRGQHRGADAGARYAAHVRDVIEIVRASGSGIRAFLFESLPSVGGQIVPPAGYLSAAYEAVRAAGGVCIADEVQVGFGRTGRHFWGFEMQGVVPDIVVCGKPIGNGHPLGAVITTPEIAASFANGMEYFNTFGGNPVSMAAGLAVLDVMEDERLQDHAREIGAQLLSALASFTSKHALVGDVRGAGLFVGVELVRDHTTLEPADREAADVVNALRDRNILIGTDGPHHNVLKIRPPMPFSATDAANIVAALEEALSEVVTAPR